MCCQWMLETCPCPRINKLYLKKNQIDFDHDFYFVLKVDDVPFPQDFIYVVNPEESKNVSVKRGFSTVNVCILMITNYNKKTHLLDGSINAIKILYQTI